MLAMVAAMKEETSGLKRHMVIEDAAIRQGYRVWRGRYKGKEALLVQTGMGREGAERATRFILEHYPVSVLVSFGFAGALTGKLNIGDVVLCSTIYCGDGPSSLPCLSDAGLISRSLRVPVSPAKRRQGGGVTVIRPVSEPVAKQRLGETFRADVVDMESYWVARLASERRVPFLAVRAVSDVVEHKLPPFYRMLNPDGRWRRREAAWYFLLHPCELAGLFGLYRNLRRARTNLTDFIDRLAEGLG